MADSLVQGPQAMLLTLYMSRTARDVAEVLSSPLEIHTVAICSWQYQHHFLSIASRLSQQHW